MLPQRRHLQVGEPNRAQKSIFELREITSDRVGSRSPVREPDPQSAACAGTCAMADQLATGPMNAIGQLSPAVANSLAGLIVLLRLRPAGVNILSPICRIPGRDG